MQDIDRTGHAHTFAEIPAARTRDRVGETRMPEPMDRHRQGPHAKIPIGHSSMMHMTLKLVRRIAICIIGTTVLLLGVVMLVLPGPALLVIPAGLAILAVEFSWARKWLRVMRAKTHQALSGS